MPPRRDSGSGGCAWGKRVGWLIGRFVLPRNLPSIIHVGLAGEVTRELRMPSIVVVVVPLVLAFWIGGATNFFVGFIFWFASSWVLGMMWQASRGRL